MISDYVQIVKNLVNKKTMNSTQFNNTLFQLIDNVKYEDKDAQSDFLKSQVLKLCLHYIDENWYIQMQYSFWKLSTSLSDNLNNEFKEIKESLHKDMLQINRNTKPNNDIKEIRNSLHKDMFQINTNIKAALKVKRYSFIERLMYLFTNKLTWK